MLGEGGNTVVCAEATQAFEDVSLSPVTLGRKLLYATVLATRRAASRTAASIVARGDCRAASAWWASSHVCAGDMAEMTAIIRPLVAMLRASIIASSAKTA